MIHEGGASAAGMLGLIRLVSFMARPGLQDFSGKHLDWTDKRCTIIIDSGTGVTATGALADSAAGSL